MSSHTVQGRGKLFFEEGRLWGDVDYHVSVMPNESLERIRGSLRAVTDPLLPLRFADIVMTGRPATLKMDDGRWLRVLLQPDGRFNGASDIKSAGQQPKL